MPFGLQKEPEVRHDAEGAFDPKGDVVGYGMPSRDDGIERGCGQVRSVGKVFHGQAAGLDALKEMLARVNCPMRRPSIC